MDTVGSERALGGPLLTAWFQGSHTALSPRQTCGQGAQFLSTEGPGSYCVGNAALPPWLGGGGGVSWQPGDPDCTVTGYPFRPEWGCWMGHGEAPAFRARPGPEPGPEGLVVSMPTPKGTTCPTLGVGLPSPTPHSQSLSVGLPGGCVHACVRGGGFNFYRHKKCETFTLSKTNEPGLFPHVSC